MHLFLDMAPKKIYTVEQKRRRAANQKAYRERKKLEDPQWNAKQALRAKVRKY